MCVLVHMFVTVYFIVCILSFCLLQGLQMEISENAIIW